jgi:hypothetical protein
MAPSLRIDDLIIVIAYFSIPVQIVYSLWLYPRLASMSVRVLILVILFALFIFLCGAGTYLNLTATGAIRCTPSFNHRSRYVAFPSVVNVP